MGGALVDGRVVATLYRSRVSLGTVLLLVAAVLIAGAAALSVSDAGEAALAWVRVSWTGLTETVGGWFG
jgi:uncharacterized membrane-anchored protein